MWLVPPSPLDIPVLAGPLAKPRREDLQTWSFLLAAGASGARHPLGILPGEDPPDRELFARELRWAVELTELTAEDVRSELARARRVGRELERVLRRDERRFSHLRGRRVVASFAPEAGAWPDIPAGVNDLADALAEDRGCVGEGIDLSRGLPDRMRTSGLYGTYGAVVLQVYPDGVEDEITLVASAQAQIRRSEVRAAVAARVAAKDDPRNDVLLMTCGLPDERGHVCGLDQFIYSFVAEDVRSGGPSVAAEHLGAIVLHHWGTPHWLEIYRKDDFPLPWEKE